MSKTGFHRGSGNRLQPFHAELFPGDRLIDRLARVVCRAGCLPRKELFEAWEVMRRARRRLRGRRLIELACGHGLAARIGLLLDPKIESAVVVDESIPASAAKVAAELELDWPRLGVQVETIEADLGSVALEATDIVIGIHACGPLSDRILDLALAARSSLALLPCCHRVAHHHRHWLTGWVDDALATDLDRARLLEAAGYRVWTQEIPAEITPKNRLLMARPQ